MMISLSSFPSLACEFVFAVLFGFEMWLANVLNKIKKPSFYIDKSLGITTTLKVKEAVRMVKVNTIR